MKDKILNRLLLVIAFALVILVIYRLNIKNNFDFYNDVFSQYTADQIYIIKYYGAKGDTFSISNETDIYNFLNLLKHAKLKESNENNKVFGEYNYEIFFENGDVMYLAINDNRILYNKHVYIIKKSIVNELYNLGLSKNMWLQKRTYKCKMVL